MPHLGRVPLRELPRDPVALVVNPPEAGRIRSTPPSAPVVKTLRPMARPLRCAPPGTLHHVMARGNARMAIYLDARDYARFLTLLEEAVARYALTCYTYCLMPNHYHLLLETRRDQLSAGMGYLNGRYAQWWNWRHDRVGHVFQARFKAQLVQEDRYFRGVCRYIVRNPVRSGLVADPADWPWSSYRATVGLAACPPLLDSRRLLAHFGTRRGDAVSAYRRWVDPDHHRTDARVSGMVRGDTRIIGDREFVESFEDRLKAADRLEVPARERLAARPPLPEVLVRTPAARRNASIVAACIDHGYGQRDVARWLSLHPASVSRILVAQRAAAAARRSGQSASLEG